MDCMTLHQREEAAFLRTYKRLGVEIAGGTGIYLIDSTGRRYLDLLAGVAVNALGYGHPRLRTAILDQVEKYIHISNYFVQQPQVELAERLRQASGYKRVFFCNSGTEASEAALKLARRWGDSKGKSAIVAMQNSFHGRTMGALSLMDAADYKKGFGPFLDGVQHVRLNDCDRLRESVSGETAAVFLECIQGEGGVFEVDTTFVEELNRLKERFEFIIIADEVQSGIGRTGKFLGCDHYGLRPDVVTLAKPLGGGLPLGALLVSEELENVLQPGSHGTTFGGNPVACAAGNVVIDEVVNNGLMKNAGVTGSYFFSRLKSLQLEMPEVITDVRGKGLMIGVELSFPGKAVTDKMLEYGIIINCTHTNVLRLVPPLIISPPEVDLVCTTLNTVLRDPSVATTSKSV